MPQDVAVTAFTFHTSTSTIMDLFAAALEDTCNVDPKVEATATRALSQGLPPRQGTAPSQGIAAIDELGAISSDDCKEISEVPRQVPETPEKVIRAKRVSSVPEHPCRKKKKYNPKNSLQLARITYVDGDNMPCVFVSNGSQQVPVPLWCQYTATWRDVDFGDSRWIIVSNYESWIMGLVDAVTNKRVRDVAKTFADHFRKQFQTAMATARKAQNLEDPLSDSDSENAVTATSQACDWPSRCTAGVKSAVVEISLGEFTIVSLNSNRKLTLKIDEATVKFIAGWIVPLVRVCAKTKASSQEVLGCGASTALSQDDLNGFQLRDRPTPNIRDKVCWNPTAHKWKVFLKNAKDKPSEDFAVDPTQDAETYQKQKVDAYWRAVETWNRLDSSNRFRIPMNRFAQSSAAD